MKRRKHLVFENNQRLILDEFYTSTPVNNTIVVGLDETETQQMGRAGDTKHT